MDQEGPKSIAPTFRQSQSLYWSLYERLDLEEVVLHAVIVSFVLVMVALLGLMIHSLQSLLVGDIKLLEQATAYRLKVPVNR